MCKNVLKQIIEGLHYIHCHGILHRDLKPSNILINGNQEIFIADFGLSKYFNYQINQNSLEIQTLFYRAPEILFGTNKYDIGVDIWSIFVIFYELIENKPLFPSDSEFSLIINMLHFYGNPSQDYWPELYNKDMYKNFLTTLPQFKTPDRNTLIRKYFNQQLWDECSLDLILKLGQFNPRYRLSLHEALQHPFFQ